MYLRTISLVSEYYVFMSYARSLALAPENIINTYAHIPFMYIFIENALISLHITSRYDST